MSEREILFRGKRVDNGEWIEGVAFPHDNGRVTMFRQHRMDGSLEGKEVILETVGEYTNLTDKNGTKIFEGDIIKVLLSGNPQPIGVVKYGVTGICGFCVITERGYSNYVLDKSEYFEVIGNIHDNSELLKGD